MKGRLFKRGAGWLRFLETYMRKEVYLWSTAMYVNEKIEDDANFSPLEHLCT